jgi:hypothetical protein
MVSCAWCQREEATQTLSFGGSRVDESPELPLSLCGMCARLLAPFAFASELHDDWDIVAVGRSAVDHQLAEVFASGAGAADRCWWCVRPGAPVDCSQHEGAQLRFEQPVLCDVCAGLSGHLSGGFAHVDEQRSAATERAVETLAREANPPTTPLRQRSSELVLVKLALLEMQATDDLFADPGDGFAELAGSLGLSENEARAQILGLFNESDSPVTFYRFDGTVVPMLSPLGRRELRELQHQHRLGPPFATVALRSRSLRRALHELDAAPLPR